VWNVTSQKKIHGLQLTLDGRSYVHWSSGGKNKSHYYSTCVYFNTKVALKGRIHQVLKGNRVDSEPSIISPGSYIFPFEMILPMDLPPTLSGNPDQWIRYSALVFVNFVSGADKFASSEFTILSNHKTIRPELIGAEASKLVGQLADPQAVNILVHGPLTAFTGETYALSIKIQNHGKKPITSITAILRYDYWITGRGSSFGKFERHHGSRLTINEWKLNNLPGLPIEPNSSWEGTVDIVIPQGLLTSLHSSFCPNIQNAYMFKVKVSAKSNAFSKATGTTKMPILMANRHANFAVEMPAEAQGPLNQLWLAPAPPNVFDMLPPALSSDVGKSIPSFGGSQPIGFVSAMPGAFIAPHVSEAKLPNYSDQSSYSFITEDLWKPGQTPAWVKSEGISPDVHLSSQ
jgi:hypothetical protein